MLAHSIHRGEREKSTVQREYGDTPATTVGSL
jgi:hypothetical protein